jgi:hypothetical protein
MDDHYTVTLRDKKYTITNKRAGLELRRHSEPWPGADDLRFCNVLIAAVERIEELEVALRNTLDGTTDTQGCRKYGGMRDYLGHQMIGAWHYDLRKVLEQK